MSNQQKYTFCSGSQEILIFVPGLRFVLTPWIKLVPVGWKNNINKYAVTCRRFRYTAYRCFVEWCWQRLGNKVRVVIPSCVVLAIRKKYPSHIQAYTGFQLPNMVPWTRKLYFLYLFIVVHIIMLSFHSQIFAVFHPLPLLSSSVENKRLGYAHKYPHGSWAFGNNVIHTFQSLNCCIA
jgi:hypothetical protein